MHETGGKPHFPTLIDLDILDPESGLPRIPIPRTSAPSIEVLGNEL
jgi:hypothetical protein